jgi:hypothetical protein
MNESRLKETLLVGDQQMVHNTVAKVGRKDLTRLGAVSKKTDGTAGTVGMRAQCLLHGQQVGLGVDLECQGVQGSALVTAALAIVPPQRREGIEGRVNHQPPRTARTWSALFLSSLFTLPLSKLTFHAFDELPALVVDDQ